jgi:predicted oxidoreductase (fatty acid repression mutant protein)
MNKDLSSLYAERRSVYSLGNRQILPETEISGIIADALKFCPSAFNSQSARVVILYGDYYRKLWDIVLTELSKVVPEDKMPATIEKIKTFSAGLGTVLFFEDASTVESLQKKFPLYAENFPKWSLESNGMLQYMIWLALSEKNIGASLQHYNPLIDDEVKLAFDLPGHWQLLAQMPFGSIERPADEKSFLPMDERLKIFG